MENNDNEHTTLYTVPPATLIENFSALLTAMGMVHVFSQRENIVSVKLSDHEFSYTEFKTNKDSLELLCTIKSVLKNKELERIVTGSEAYISLITSIKSYKKLAELMGLGKEECAVLDHVESLECSSITFVEDVLSFGLERPFISFAKAKKAVLGKLAGDEDLGLILIRLEDLGELGFKMRLCSPQPTHQHRLFDCVFDRKGLTVSMDFTPANSQPGCISFANVHLIPLLQSIYDEHITPQKDKDEHQ